MSDELTPLEAACIKIVAGQLFERSQVDMEGFAADDLRVVGVSAVVDLRILVRAVIAEVRRHPEDAP